MAKTLTVLPQGVKRLFGTSGIRGVVGTELSGEFCHEVAQAIGTSLEPGSKVCIATDTRLSREMLKEAVTSGLRLSGIDTTNLGILPTPALAFLTRDMGFDTGVMITASHNPPEFNGIKLFNDDSLGYSRRQEARMERIYHARNFRTLHPGSLSRREGAGERYLRFILSRFPRFEHYPRVVVDAGNGAASGFASELFSITGLEVIPLNDEPDGHFPGRDPEPKEDTLGGTNDLLEYGASEAGGYTIVEFKRKLDTGDDYDREIIKGEENGILWAFGGLDGMTAIHSQKGFGDIQP